MIIYVFIEYINDSEFSRFEFIKILRLFCKIKMNT